MEMDDKVPFKIFGVMDIFETGFGTEAVYDKIHGWKEGDKTAPEERERLDKEAALTTETL
jgi:hypothetical protein